MAVDIDRIPVGLDGFGQTPLRKDNAAVLKSAFAGQAGQLSRSFRIGVHPM